MKEQNNDPNIITETYRFMVKYKLVHKFNVRVVNDSRAMAFSHIGGEDDGK